MTDAARILVVDDDPTTAKILRNALGDMGTIHVVTSGAEALQLAADYPINLVLLDIVMPTMDGFETCRALRRDHPDLHVVFLTAADEPAMEVQALAVGGHDFIGKPINPPVVRARVALHLQLQAQATARQRVEDTLRSITDAAHDAIVLMNPQGAISFWNPAATAMLGYTAEEALGKNLHDLLAPDRYLGAHRAALPEFQRTGRGLVMGKMIELSARRQDGQEIAVEISLATIALNDGWHSIGILRDVTERNRMQERLRLSEERYRLLTDNAIDNLWTMDLDGNFTYLSPSIETLAGYTPSEMKQKALDEILTPDSLARANEYLERVNACVRAGHTLDVFRGELELRRKDGSILWTEVIASPLCDSNGRFLELVGVTRDIDERKRLEDEFHKQSLLLTTVLTNMDAHVYMKDREGRFLYVNRPVAELLGRRAEEVVGHLDTEFIPAANIDEIRAVDIEVFTAGTRQSREERFTDQAGTTRYFWSVKVPLIQADQADALIGISTDITELRQLREELERRATTDSLTGLANRGHFYQQAILHFQQAQRYGEALSLLALDIDHFKSINDTHGHQAGDSVLRGLAEHFRQGIRAFDLIGRIGGEEFAILLPNTDLEGAVELAERLRETLTELRFKVDGGTELAVAVSIGAASLLPTDASLDSLFARADQALYRAKGAGRNRVATIEERAPGKSASILRLRWLASYDCGEPIIDREHRELFRLANELLDLASADALPHAIRASLDRLLAHVVGHFAHEEAILRRHGYDDVEHHAELHRRLIERVLALSAQADNEGIAFGDLVQLLAQEVVARHMLAADRKFYGLFAKPNAS